MSLAFTLAVDWFRLLTTIGVTSGSLSDADSDTETDDQSENAADEPADEEPSPSDNELMRRYAEQGDVDAFEQLLTRHRDPLFRFLLKKTGGRQAPAEDLLQETFARVVDNASAYEPSHAFSTWLYTIARNLSIDRSRQASHNRTESLEASDTPGEEDRPRRDRLVDEEASSSTVAHDRQAFRERLQDALDDLPEDQRDVFVLREVSGLTFPEIADVVDAPPGTVKSRMRYALKALRRHLERFEGHSFDRADRQATGQPNE